MSVLITGGSGFLSKGIVRRLLDTGCERICIFSRGEYAQARMRRELGDDGRLRWMIGDVRDQARLERAMEGVGSVIAAAALKRIEVGAYNPDEMMKTNVLGSQNTIEAARRMGVKKVLFISSDKAFEPASPYGHTKALAESLFLTANTVFPTGPKFACCRYGNVWNSTGSVVPTWKEILAGGAQCVPVTNPDATRFFMRLDEAVDLVLGTLGTMLGGEIAIPHLPAYLVGDLADAMGAKMSVLGMGAHEKLHESMAAGNCSRDARRMSVVELREELANV